MQRPLVSIVLPVWNGENYLALAIESVISQTLSDWELIIVDDSSSDSSRSIAEAFSQRDSRIQVIINSENLKVPRSLNIGFSHASGQWLTWTSHDNLLSHTFLESLIGAALSEASDFVYSNYQVIDEIGKVRGISYVATPENLIFGDCVGASFIYSRKVALEVGLYDETKFMFEDYDYWTRIYLAGFKITTLNEAPYMYRRHSKQLTTTLSTPDNYIEFRRKLLLDFETDKTSKARAIILYLLLSWRKKPFNESIKFVTEAFLLSPWQATRQFLACLRNYFVSRAKSD